MTSSSIWQSARWQYIKGTAIRATMYVATYIERECKNHGLTQFVLEGRGYYRCVICRSRRIAERRRKNKAVLVAEHGGACRLCGYERCVRALQFHHRDPTTKEFGISFQGRTASLDSLRQEATKCVLLCSNCHAEVESGLVDLSSVA